MTAVQRYRWPGNVRELANIVERLAILHGTGSVSAADVASVLPVSAGAAAPAGVGAAAGSPAPAADTLDRPLSDALDEYERALITRAMSAAGGNVAEAARRLQTDRPNLYRRMRRLGIDWGGATTPSGGSFAGNSLA